MIIIHNEQELKQLINKQASKTIGFVPTMGALHNGHIALIKQARIENELLVVSIFINPTQFLEGEDLTSYPKKEEADIKICSLAKVDILFMPEYENIYTKDEILIKAPKINGFIFEGYNRPGHFDGVLQIVLKLFNLVNPTKAYFGKKDAQQLVLIKQMVKNFYLNIEIVPCETVRDDEGLALSSRNIYLTNQEKKEALKLSKSLYAASRTISMGNTNIEEIKNVMMDILSGINIEYLEIVSRNFSSLKTIEPHNTIILVAAKIGKTRLLDNIWI